MNKATLHRLLDSSGLPVSDRASIREQIDKAEGEETLKALHASIRRRAKGVPQHKGR